MKDQGYSHRYKSDNGFDNPSVYCEDLKALIDRMTARPTTAPSPTRRTAGVPGDYLLSKGAFDLLSAGSGDPSGVAELLDTRWAINRALVALRLIGTRSRRGVCGIERPAARFCLLATAWLGFGQGWTALLPSRMSA